jgi:hypothetical protein
LARDVAKLTLSHEARDKAVKDQEGAARDVTVAHQELTELVATIGGLCPTCAQPMSVEHLLNEDGAAPQKVESCS